MKNRVCFTLFLTVFVGTFVGCDLATVTPPAPGAPTVTPSSPSITSEAGYVEPLKPSALLSTSVPADKIAAEKVPLPAVADLEGQIDAYIKKLDSDLEDLATSKNFKADATSLHRDANALALIALAIGLSDENGKLKTAAAGIVAAAKAVEKAGDLAAASAAVANVKTSLTGTADAASLGWTKVASLAPVMKAVPNINANVTRNSSTERRLTAGARVKDAQAAVTEGTAAMAVIMQGSIANYDETDKAGSADDWERLCKEFRDLALKANAEMHSFVDGKSDFAKLTASLEAMRKSCDDCHNVFHKAAVGK
ncbi:MAG: hypothetical protein LBU65_15305 [Planctomycetaceae bacterium]|jgi:hypothetical protein|nr:hypothetical protein [Planctomycetaceae bacterium]